MKLWIANSTKQHHQFQYRPRISEYGAKNSDGSFRPTHGDLRRFDVPLGGQIYVGDFDQKEIDEIFAQHPHIIQFKDLDKPSGYQGLCYRIGPDPVPFEALLERMDKNDAVRTQQSLDRQTDTAKVIATNLRSVSENSDAPFKDMRETDVQVAQTGAREVNGGTPKLNRVVEVLEAGKEASGRGRKSAA